MKKTFIKLLIIIPLVLIASNSFTLTLEEAKQQFIKNIETAENLEALLKLSNVTADSCTALTVEEDFYGFDLLCMLAGHINSTTTTSANLKSLPEKFKAYLKDKNIAYFEAVLPGEDEATAIVYTPSSKANAFIIAKSMGTENGTVFVINKLLGMSDDAIRDFYGDPAQFPGDKAQGDKWIEDNKKAWEAGQDKALKEAGFTENNF